MTNRYERQGEIPGYKSPLLNNSRILVIGAGTLGNEIIKNLTLIGVGNITVIDFDDIEEVNLNRSTLFRETDLGLPKATVAAARAKEINPLINVVGYKKDIIYEIGCMYYRNFDCVFLAVDNLEARMWVNRYCWLTQTPLLNTGINGLNGDFYLILPDKYACLECNWKPWQYQHLSEKYSCLKIGLNASEPKIPMVVTSASVIAGMAVHECVRYLSHKNEGKSYEPLTFYYTSEENHSLISWKPLVNNSCLGHLHYPSDINLLPINISRDVKIEVLCNQIANYLNVDNVELKYDHPIVYSLACNNCGKEIDITPIFLGLYIREACPFCSTLNLVPYEIDEHLKNNFSLTDLRIPPEHLLEVSYCVNKKIEKCWIQTGNEEKFSNNKH